jgi:hypothetical protein
VGRPIDGCEGQQMVDGVKEVPKGQRFSHVYLERGKPRGESPRMRRRIASAMWEFSAASDNFNFYRIITGQLGVEPPTGSMGGILWNEFFANAEPRDILDFVTLAYRHGRELGRNSSAGKWLKDVETVFREESIHYTVDDQGGIHPYVDQEFTFNSAATIAVLQSGRYSNARDAFEGAMNALAQAPPDGKAAIRAVFSAAENVFKLIASKDRLGMKEADDLGQIIDKLYASDGTARNSAKKMLNSFKDWVDAAHFYRHEPGTEDVAQPPLALAVYLVSTGASHLRWLAELDSAGRK